MTCTVRPWDALARPIALAGIRGFDLALACGALLLIGLVLGPVATIPMQIPLDYNEGWNAGFAARAVMPGTGPLYPGPDTLVFNNYPPLGFLIVGAAGRWLVGDMIVAGRIIALLGLLASGALVALCLRRLGLAWRPAIAGGLAMLLLIATWFRVYVAMDDPQWLAHAVMLAGLAVLVDRPERLRGGPLPVVRIAAAALLMVMAGFIKHNLVALPLATTIWLLWLRPRACAVWLAAAAVALAAGAMMVWLAWGADAFADILGHHRVFTPARALFGLQKLLPLIPAGLVIGLMLRRSPHRIALGLVVPFLAVALVTGVLQRIGDGVYYNAQFPTVIALSLALGIALDAAIARPPRLRGTTIGAPALLVFAALPLIGAAPQHLRLSVQALTQREARAAAWAPMIGALAAADGPVGCQMLSLCAWAGRPFGVDMFNLTQKVLTGGPDSGFAAMLAAHRFALIEDDPHSSIHAEARDAIGHDPFADILARNYRVLLTGPGGTRLLAPDPAMSAPSEGR
ncbi:hypothetical protein FHR90_000044 [Endobacter medicaginis]|uniref:Glycosyltransferase RgtA/B/C/D-like domain-containing protein n=4 Tax=Endobacter medicaginis TaxID=1181271 RepID=A0A839UPX1_9PROT|nr:hypothetical protein [Endobacter medicaginis]MBB3172238.1 hypothetical protein [Endobacter medicaginis]MCX5474642.1 hypothetical protein [Endobacter medicaginis]